MHNITWLIAETQKINFPSTNRSISYLHVVYTSTIRLCATKPYDAPVMLLNKVSALRSL